MSGGHLRLLAATRVAASGRGKCRKVSVGGCQAATCGHLRPLEWLQVAENGCRRQEIDGGHLRPLAATRVAASGCWLQMAAGDNRLLAATCGHLRPLEWLQVAAISKIKLRASCVLNV